MAPPTRVGRACLGYAYLAILLFIAISGIALSTAATVWHEEARREKEQELLFVGEQFRRAILQYYENSPGIKKYPLTLQDLPRDVRQPGIRRYLRQVYRDPMTGKSQWGLVQAPGGGIMGVYSLADGVPIKQSLFPEHLAAFEGKGTYRDWTFVYAPLTSAPGSAAGQFK